MKVLTSIFLLATFASFATAAVTYDVARHTWTLATGPVVYRLHQEGKAVELEYFGPDGKPAWPAATPQTGARYELSATVEGQNIEDRDWELVDHQEQPEALLLVFRHPQTPLVVEARYATYGDTGVISRELTIVNKGKAAVHLLAIDSVCWRLPLGDYDLSYLYGGAAAERQLMTEKLSVGMRSLISGRGRSSALYAAWFGLRDHTLGVQYAGQLAWSGDWEMHFDREVTSARRAVSGTLTAEMRLRNDFGGAMVVNPGQTMPLPLAAFTASTGDLDDAVNQLHRYQRHFAIPRTGINRPLVSQFNSWYPFRANFTEDQLKYGVSVAKDLGLDSYVIDDGWFARDAQGHELFGDWEADPKIFQQGMPEFAQYVHAKGLKFGLWVEMGVRRFWVEGL
jgi:alpha-galactosidase